MLATFASIQSYTGAQITETTWYYENLTAHNHFYQCTVQRAKTGDTTCKTGTNTCQGTGT